MCSVVVVVVGICSKREGQARSPIAATPHLLFVAPSCTAWKKQCSIISKVALKPSHHLYLFFSFFLFELIIEHCAYFLIYIKQIIPATFVITLVFFHSCWGPIDIVSLELKFPIHYLIMNLWDKTHTDTFFFFLLLLCSCLWSLVFCFSVYWFWLYLLSLIPILFYCKVAIYICCQKFQWAPRLSFSIYP